MHFFKNDFHKTCIFVTWLAVVQSCTRRNHWFSWTISTQTVRVHTPPTRHTGHQVCKAAGEGKPPTFGLAAIRRIAPLICRVVRCGCWVLGLDSKLGTFGFHPQPPIPAVFGTIWNHDFKNVYISMEVWQNCSVTLTWLFKSSDIP